MSEQDSTGSWVEMLEPEDLAFTRRFVMASGSLKALAEDYGISYPTVRLRLDRLIAKLEIFEKHAGASEFEKILRAQYVDGKLDLETLKKLLVAHRKELRARSKV